jgi:biopolymer transport protein ExbB
MSIISAWSKCRNLSRVLLSVAGFYSCAGLIPAQTLTPATPAQEFLRLNGQLVAIETNVQGATGPSAGYQYVRQLSVNGSSVTSNLLNFPVLFAATLPELANVANGGHVNNPNGYDIVFTLDAAGSQKANWEVESYDSTSGTIWCWIQIPNFVAGSNPKIYLFYGNPAISADQSSRTATWDSTFTAVYHFAAKRFANDATGHNFNATFTGPVVGPGEINQSASFSNGGYFSVPDNALFNTQAGTWQFWFKDDGPPIIPNAVTRPAGAAAIKVTPNGVQFVGDCASVLSKGDPHDTLNGIGFATCNGGLFVQAKSNTATTQTQNIGTTSGWHQVVFSYTAGSTYTYYEDGSPVDSGSLIPFTIEAQPLRMGVSLNPGWPDSFIGRLDEVRISNTVRSSAWIAAERANQANPQTFVTVGPETTH